MVRFCDREISSVEYNCISRQELLHYFLKGHLEEIVCIYNEYGYMGYTTYHTLLHSISLEAAVIRDVLILDESIWTDAKKLFVSHKSHINKHPLLPVIDREGNLVSFAYEDDDANRELRQLRELEELRRNSNAAQFTDLYPDCGCVVIYGFNELAYFFAYYLRELEIPVRVEDAMWEGFFESDAVQVLEHRCMKIYAEGTWAKPADWEENLLRTVSVEFECIDRVYEENIRKGYICDAVCGCEEMLLKLKDEGIIAVLGTDVEAQEAYNFLLAQGIEPECFVIQKDRLFERKLFGKPVYGVAEAIAKYGNDMAIVDNHYENSAWGIGDTDYLEYLGYQRNKGFFLLKDYTEVLGNSLKSALMGQKIVMVGDVLLCEKLFEYFRKNMIVGVKDMVYMQLPEEGENMSVDCMLEMVSAERVSKDTFCLVVVPEYFGAARRAKYVQRIENITSFLRKNEFINYTDYFSFTKAFIDIEKEEADKYPNGTWKPKGIVLGAIEPHQGNVFFMQLLDGHPSIMLMHMGCLTSALFWFCVQLGGREAEEILPLFTYLYKSVFGKEELENEKICNFIENGSGRKLLKSGERYTSQELFVLFHAILYGKDMDDISDMTIYWEPHSVPRDLVEMFVKWLGDGGILCHIVNVTRNICMAKGSSIKWILNSGSSRVCYWSIFLFADIKKKKYESAKRIIVKFEDLKCRPREELDRICKELDVPWSESLMQTTEYGRRAVFYNYAGKVQDFDLDPVYNQYEEYFSEFDRFRITMLCAPWQKKYGYPCVDIDFFSKKDLQEVFLKDFRFKDKIDFNKEFGNEKGKLHYFIEMQETIRQSLQKVRMLAFLEDVTVQTRVSRA